MAHFKWALYLLMGRKYLNIWQFLTGAAMVYTGTQSFAYFRAAICSELGGNMIESFTCQLSNEVQKAIDLSTAERFFILLVWALVWFLIIVLCKYLFKRFEKI